MTNQRGLTSTLFCLCLMTATAVVRADQPASPPDEKMRVAGVVLKWVRGDKEANFRRAEPLIRRAAAQGAELVCTTECFLDGYAIDDKHIPLEEFRALGEPIPGGPYYRRLSQLADELNIHLVAGLIERDGEHLFNTAVLIGPDGSLVGKYHKQVLEHEAVRLEAGDRSTTVATPFGTVGMMVCADRRDKEIVNAFCTNGAEWLVCPSGGMYGPKKNDPILQARSRENHAYIVFVHPAEFLVTAPDGTIAARALLGDTRDVDPDEIGTSRDSSGVFCFDMEYRDGRWQESALQRRLREPLLVESQPYEELRAFVEPRIPAFTAPETGQQWQEEAVRLRQLLLEKVVLRGEAQAWREAPAYAEWMKENIAGPGYRIRKFRYEALPGLWVPALLYEPAQLRERMPVVINVNGHDRDGKAAPYKQRRCINLARRGMLAFDLEFLGMGQLRDDRQRSNKHNRLLQLDLCGTSGLAPFYLILEKCLDVALTHEHADPDRVAVTGLSGGGWQTILLAALDTRITLANPVAGHCSLYARTSRRNNVGDAEQIPSDLATVADYTHLTAMVAPRPLLLTYNAQDDCCFLPADVLPELESATRPVYRSFGLERNFRTHINYQPGTHNFDEDNREALYKLLLEHSFVDGPEQVWRDLPIEDAEIRTAEELAVKLPSHNATLNSLAVRLCRPLPTENSQQRAARRPDKARERLAEIVAWEESNVDAEQVSTSQTDEVETIQWRLRTGDQWTIPAVEFIPKDSKSSVIVLSDHGRSMLLPVVEKHLSAGQRVLAIDLFGFGEARGDLKEAEPFLIATVGGRPLGVQAGQLTAIAGWLCERDGAAVRISAVGPRACTIALIAAGLETEAILALDLHDPLFSLKTLIESNMLPDEAPELFCFGLLEEFDIPQLTALVAPREVEFSDN